MTQAFYNENEPYAVEWLRNLMREGLITAGTVAARSIVTVRPEQLGYDRVHFFAGIGGWDLALDMAGWPEDLQVWTGSCPCQPFSISGKKQGESDVRHLWPIFRGLIQECRPPVIFGEQVASPLGRKWLAGVRADLEALGYRVGAADLCAAGVGAPHIRQRLYWVADTQRYAAKPRRSSDESAEGVGTPTAGASVESGRCGVSCGMEHPVESRLEGLARNGDDRRQSRRVDPEAAGSAPATGGAGGMGDAQGDDERRGSDGTYRPRLPVGRSGAWSQYDAIPCGDGKSRRVEPGTFPLAHGVPARVGKLRAYGNAIVPKKAAEFIKAYLEARSLKR